jgi:hypothetical protein
MGLAYTGATLFWELYNMELSCAGASTQPCAVDVFGAGGVVVPPCRNGELPVMKIQQYVIGQVPGQQESTFLTAGWEQVEAENF